MNAPHGVRPLLADALPQESAHVNLAGQRGDDGQNGGADGDGHCNFQQLLGGISKAFWGIPGFGQLAVALAEAAVQIHCRYQAAGCHA